VPDRAQELLSELLSEASAALVAELLHRVGEARLRVAGGSMYPVVRSGDTLTVRRCGADALCDGDIVLLRDGARLFAHRLLTRRPHRDPSPSGSIDGSIGGSIEDDGCWLITRGDSHWQRDPVRPVSALLGRVVSLTRGGIVVDEPFELSWWDRVRGLACSAWIDLRQSLSGNRSQLR